MGGRGCFILSGLLAALLAAPGVGQVIYINDFERDIGGEWSNTRTDVTPSGRRFLGQLTNEATRLTLKDLPPHQGITLYFDLYVINSWPGNCRGCGTAVGKAKVPHGADVWRLRVDGTRPLLQTTFSNINPPYSNHGQAYPGVFPGEEYPPRTGADESQTLGYPLDTVYQMRFTFPHSLKQVEFEFTAVGLPSLPDGSWGLDNVQVELIPRPLAIGPQQKDRPLVTPAPGAVVLGVIGLALVGWVKKRFGQD